MWRARPSPDHLELASEGAERARPARHPKRHWTCRVRLTVNPSKRCAVKAVPRSVPPAGSIVLQTLYATDRWQCVPGALPRERAHQAAEPRARCGIALGANPAQNACGKLMSRVAIAL